MKETLRISAIDFLGRHAGMHYYMAGLCSGLQHAGAEVVLYTTSETGAEGTSYLSKVMFVGLYGKANIVVRGFRFLSGLARSVWDSRRRGAKIAHMHCFHYDFREVLTALTFYLLGIKVVCTFHDIDSFGKRKGARGRSLVVTAASALLVHNHFSLRALEESVGSRTPIFVVPHGHYIDAYPEAVARVDARKQLCLPEDAVIGLFFGNSRPEKGLAVYLQALASQPSLNILAVVAGKKKPEELRWLQSLEQGELAGRLRIFGKHISDEEAALHYCAANFVVVPYLRVYESGVTIMAQSFKRAVVVSDLVPLVDSTGPSGLIFKAGDIDALAACLSSAVSDLEGLDRLGELGWAKVVKDRNWQAIGDRTMSIYGYVLNAREKRNDLQASGDY